MVFIDAIAAVHVKWDASRYVDGLSQACPSGQKLGKCRLLPSPFPLFFHVKCLTMWQGDELWVLTLNCPWVEGLDPCEGLHAAIKELGGFGNGSYGVEEGKKRDTRIFMNSKACLLSFRGLLEMSVVYEMFWFLEQTCKLSCSKQDKVFWSSSLSIPGINW